MSSFVLDFFVRDAYFGNCLTFLMHLGILKLLCRSKNNKRENVQFTYIHDLKCKEQLWWQIFKRRGSSLDLGGKLDLFGSESVEAEIKLGLTLISNLGRGRKQK